GLGAIGGGLVGVSLYEFGVYVWHRALHTSNFLWRTFHQMHHSAERLDTYGAFYFSPMDMIGWTVLGSLCFALLVGLSPQAITVTLLVTNFMGMFQHANIDTPRWLGYIIQRPESHTVHHAKGIHKHNYSDLPVFDILFGTFKNPKKYEHQTGFYYGASAKVLEMLTFKDLNKEREKTRNGERAKVKKVLSLLLLVGLTMACSKDDGFAPTPDPIEEEQETKNQIPSFSEIAPLNGPMGTLVTFTGENFGTDPNKVRVFFNGIQAELESLANEKLVVSVPRGAGSGMISAVINSKELVGSDFLYELTTEVFTLVGNGERGFDDGTGATARFNNPRGIVVDKLGNLYLSDFRNHSIRKISPDGQVVTFAGNGTAGDANGIGVAAQFNGPWGLAIDIHGNLYVADTDNNKIRKISPEGEVGTLAGGKEGNIDGPIGEARFNSPRSIAVDSLGNVYIGDDGNNSIRKITTIGAVFTIAGGEIGFADGLGTVAQFDGIYDLALSPEGDLFVADNENQRIRKITPAGLVTTYAGSTEGFKDGTRDEALFDYPSSLAFDNSGNLYVGDENDKIRVISPNGIVSTLAGSETGFEDGIGEKAKLDTAYGIAVDLEGNLFTADSGNHAIRKITQE
ncbi:MAG: sterol desaturase family protein, partial [Cyclobacteriaceae bacterium]